MPDRSFPPSHFAPPSVLRSIVLAASRRPMSGSAPASAPSPRVRVYPGPDNTVLIMGITLEGKWVAEYRCLAEDFDARCVAAMERRVRAKERIGPQLVR